MKQYAASGIGPQRKIINTNDKFGNSGIKNQQGSTVIKYDTLPIDGRLEFRFFEGSAQRNFPFSNSGAQGNTLGVGNSLTVERAYLTLLQYDDETGLWVDIDKLSLSAIPGLTLAEFGFTIANSEVIKNVPILSWFPEFNKYAENALNNNFDFDTQIVIPPLLEFVATLRCAAYARPTNNVYLRLTIEGTGAIIAPRTTF